MNSTSRLNRDRAARAVLAAQVALVLVVALTPELVFAQSATVSYGWDLSGNLVSKEKQGLSRQLAWDGRNALVSVTDNGAVVGTCDYDESGQGRTGRAPSCAGRASHEPQDDAEQQADNTQS